MVVPRISPDPDGQPAYETINGAQDMPKIVFTPSKATRNAANSAPATTPPAPDVEILPFA